MQHRKGFSLIELMVVICLIATIGAIAGLNLVNYTNNRNLKSAARDIASDFAICKERAISESTTYQITFVNGGKNYTIQNVGNPPGPITTKLLSQFSTDITVQIANFAGGQQVNFLARGTVSPLPPAPGVGFVTLSNSRGSQATINVNIMGRTYVTFPNII
ncbi:MAG TPA: GspH/FimT family pseudopilin [Syntrophales bacterium]|nr:GspH/FimT family pseudopilin [Syntrophales bacterium]